MKTMFRNRWLCLLSVATTVWCLSRSAAAQQALQGIGEVVSVTAVLASALEQANQEPEVQQKNFGFAKNGPCLYGGMIGVKDSHPLTVKLKANCDYIAVVVGDRNVQDLDMRVIGPNGRILGVDNRVNPSARVAFRTGQAGTHTIRVHLFRGRQTSFCALVLLERDGWDVPLNHQAVATIGFMDAAAKSAILVQRLTRGAVSLQTPYGGASGWSLVGQVLQQGEAHSFGDLAPGNGLHVTLAAGCNAAQDIDLKVFEQNGVLVAQDIDPDAHPICIVPTRAGAKYRVETLLPASSGPSLVLTSLWKIDANGQGIQQIGAR